MARHTSIASIAWEAVKVDDEWLAAQVLAARCRENALSAYHDALHFDVPEFEANGRAYNRLRVLFI